MIKERIIAGPCGFESYEDAKSTVEFLVNKGIYFIRGGINKYRSNPKDYQGNLTALEWIKDLKQQYQFRYCVEVFSKDELDMYEEAGVLDVIQVGSRNMHNTNLLKYINYKYHNKVVILKRNYAASLQEFINHAKYMNNINVILCLRGIMGLFPAEQRFQPDLTDILRLRDLSPYSPICYDVSHSSCKKKYIPAVWQALDIYCPDYAMIEVHADPTRALSDPDQHLNFFEFNELVK